MVMMVSCTLMIACARMCNDLELKYAREWQEMDKGLLLTEEQIPSKENWLLSCIVCWWFVIGAFHVMCLPMLPAYMHLKLKLPIGLGVCSVHAQPRANTRISQRGCISASASSAHKSSR